MSETVATLATLATMSDGGYVLIRRGRRNGGSATEWRVNVRWRGREYTSVGLELAGALARTEARLVALALAQHQEEHADAS